MDKPITILKRVYDKMINKGTSLIVPEDKQMMNDIAKQVIQHPQDIMLDEELRECVMYIIKISNALYNNAPNIILPLSDDIYDQLINVCTNQGIQYPVGAPPITFTDLQENQSLKDVVKPKKKESLMDFAAINDKVYLYPIMNNKYDYMPQDFQVHVDDTKVDKKVRNTSHKYDLCGTLRKCKYTLNQEFDQTMFQEQAAISIFERDFLGAHIQQGIIDPNNIELLVSLKYDGISVEAEVQGDTLISACTRGDTSTNEASDLTPILYGSKFHRATGIVDNKETFGIKFEYIITYRNLHKLEAMNLQYVNPRNAVIGLFGRLDCRKYKDFLTPVPLETSLDIDRKDEIEFLNKYYTKDVGFRYIIVKGNYHEVLYQVKKFVDEANYFRTYNDFQYDGIVVEYTDKALRNYLGKTNAIPNYAVAIKFPPLTQISRFDHYEYTVGQDGVITPMAIYDPVKFFGATNDKASVHSFKRFNQLQLRKNDKVRLTFVNDVMVYLTKAEDYIQEPNNNPIEQFPTECPCCHTPLIITESGLSAKCPNFFCPERVVGRVTNMLKKLNIKDFSTQMIRALKIKSLTDLLSIETDKPRLKYIQSVIGDIMTEKLKERIKEIRETKYPDYRLIGSLGFDGVANDKWKRIMANRPLEDLIKLCGNSDIQMQLQSLSTIKGIGPKTVEIIVNQLPYFVEDLKTIQTKCNPQQTLSLMGEQSVILPKIRFTGLRPDQQTMDEIMSHGFDVSLTSGVTKDTAVVIVPFMGFTSNNVSKAFKYLSDNLYKASGQSIKIDYNNLNCVDKSIMPNIMTLNEFLSVIRNS